MDRWLVWKLTGGRRTRPTRRTRRGRLLVSLATLDWEDELLELFGVPRDVLPEIRPSSGVVGEGELLGATVPIAGIAGDQQAALFGQACFEPGQAKATYGTGSFLLAHTGASSARPRTGSCDRGRAGRRPPAYALEGSVFVAGAAVQWLRDGLGLLATRPRASGSRRRSRTAAASTSCRRSRARVAALGAGRAGADRRHHARDERAHLVRAALESIALQTADVVEALPTALASLRADGGATANAFLMQLQADLLGVPVEVARERETTALGAAALAGLGLGIWGSTDELAAACRPGAVRARLKAPDGGAAPS